MQKYTSPPFLLLCHRQMSAAFFLPGSLLCYQELFLFTSCKAATMLTLTHYLYPFGSSFYLSPACVALLLSCFPLSSSTLFSYCKSHHFVMVLLRLLSILKGLISVLSFSNDAVWNTHTWDLLKWWTLKESKTLNCKDTLNKDHLNQTEVKHTVQPVLWCVSYRTDQRRILQIPVLWKALPALTGDPWGQRASDFFLHQ